MFLSNVIVTRSSSSSGLDFAPYQVSPHIPEYCPLLQARQFHVNLHTLSPSLPAPAHTFHPCHLHISSISPQDDTQLIIFTLMLKMSKQSQSYQPYPSHTEYSEGCTNPHCAFYLSRTPHTHPYLTIIHSALSRLFRFSAFIAKISAAIQS